MAHNKLRAAEGRQIGNENNTEGWEDQMSRADFPGDDPIQPPGFAPRLRLSVEKKLLTPPLFAYTIG
jgi:hypothetical protein